LRSAASTGTSANDKQALLGCTVFLLVVIGFALIALLNPH
jgi:hypothetical protein